SMAHSCVPRTTRSSSPHGAPTCRAHGSSVRPSTRCTSRSSMSQYSSSAACPSARRRCSWRELPASSCSLSASWAASAAVVREVRVAASSSRRRCSCRSPAERHAIHRGGYRMSSNARAASRRVAVLCVSLLAAPARVVAQDADPFAALEWRNIGPDRGGRSIAVGGSDSRPLEYYFGATGGGLWKTTDGGTTWDPVTDGQINSASVGSIAVCPANPDIVYIGTGETQL